MGSTAAAAAQATQAAQAAAGAVALPHSDWYTLAFAADGTGWVGGTNGVVRRYAAGAWGRARQVIPSGIYLPTP